MDKFLTNPSARVVVSGHTEEQGTRKYNLAMGHLMTSAVGDYLIANVIECLEMKKVSYVEEKPRLKGSNEEAGS